MFQLLNNTDILRSEIVTHSIIYKERRRVTPTGVLAKRVISSTNNPSASMTKSAKCTDSKQKCEVPTDSNSTTEITVAVAVAVPVVIVAIFLCIILFMVYKRSKQEEQEDEDPEFEGDSEYLPQHGPYKMNQQSSSSDSNQYIAEKNSGTFIQKDTQDNANLASNRGSSWVTEPFQLPQMENVDSLRQFAKQVQNDGLGGYHLASMNVSQPSFHNRTMNMDHESFNSATGLSNMNTMIYQNGSLNPVVVSKNGMNSNCVSNLHSNGGPLLKDVSYFNKSVKINDLQNINSEKLTFPQEFHSIENGKDDNENFDYKYGNTKNNTASNNNNNNANKLEIEKKENKYESTSQHQSEDDEKDSSSLSLILEEENIQRIKSIYRVYMDTDENVQNLTTTNLAENKNTSDVTRVTETNLHEFDNNRFHYNQTPLIQDTANTTIKNQHVTIQQNKVEEYNDQESISADDDIKHSNIGSNRGSYRVTSSIYSEIPVTTYPPTQQKLQQQYDYNYDSNMDIQSQQLYNKYPFLSNSALKDTHPQTSQQLDELPNSQKSIRPNSSHRLASFKSKSKLQNRQKQSPLHHFRLARVNGTAISPMNHSKRFYSNNNDKKYNVRFQQQQQQQQLRYRNKFSASFLNGNDQMSTVPLPHQTRKSIVMTNPVGLQAPMVFKPAGSIRSLGLSLLKQNMSYSERTYSWASELLDHNDMIQPPSIGEILPHSGSPNNLRKQLGPSDNYFIQ